MAAGRSCGPDLAVAQEQNGRGCGDVEHLLHPRRAHGADPPHVCGGAASRSLRQQPRQDAQLQNSVGGGEILRDGPFTAMGGAPTKRHPQRAPAPDAGITSVSRSCVLGFPGSTSATSQMPLVARDAMFHSWSGTIGPWGCLEDLLAPPAVTARKNLSGALPCSASGKRDAIATEMPRAHATAHLAAPPGCFPAYMQG